MREFGRDWRSERAVQYVRRRLMPQTLSVLVTGERSDKSKLTAEEMDKLWRAVLCVPAETPKAHLDLVYEYVAAEIRSGIPSSSHTHDTAEAISWILIGRVSLQALPAAARYRARVALLALASLSAAARALVKNDIATLPPEFSDLSALRGRILSGAGFADPVAALRAAWNGALVGATTVAPQPVAQRPRVTQLARAGRKRGGLREEVRLAIRTAKGKRLTLEQLALEVKEPKSKARKAADGVLQDPSGEFARDVNDDGPIYFVRPSGAI